MNKQDVEKIPESVKLFEKALESPNLYIRQAAAEELANLLYAGTELSAKTENRVRKEASGLWAAAFEAAGDKQKTLEFLLNFERAASSAEARSYVFEECEKQEVFFNEKELAAINGHFAISGLRYNEALAFFNVFMEDGEWPRNLPDIFFEYPVLINDLGRAFQYTSYGLTGLSVFSRWEENLAGNITEDTRDLRYRLLFYAARIARRNGQISGAVSLFEKAFFLAPDAEQSDACVWYILDLSLAENQYAFMKRLEQYIYSWNDAAYFDDLLEKHLHSLVSRREWENVTTVFNIIKNRGVFSAAAYAWTIARLIEEGFIREENKDNNLLYETAYNAPENDISSFLYYRSLGASVLELPFLEIPANNAGDGKREKHSDALKFILGFFDHNADGYVMPYIRQMEDDLSIEELRAVAQALENAGMYIQSIQLVSRYVKRDGYVRDRRDMELLFPRPFGEFVDEYAAQTGIAPEIIFGLIRTESAFQSGVVSRAGAVGLTQLMPDTAAEMAGRIRRAGGPDYAAAENGLNLFDPAQNIHIGTYYLNYLMERFDNTLLSLMAYNGGMNRIRRWRAASTLPVDLFLETITLAETRDYGRKVIAAAAVYEYLYYNGD